MEKDKESGLGALLNYEDALQKGQQPDTPVRKRPDAAVQEQSDMPEKSPVTGLRATLQKMFPLLPTVDERIRFHGWIRKLVTRKSCSSDESYLATAAAIIIFRVNVGIGFLLLSFFMYLAAHGLNADPYLAALFPNPAEPMRHYGIVGLYAHYYVVITRYPVIFVGVACFVLFLIHVKRGDEMPFKGGALIIKENRTTANMIKVFFAGTFVLGLGSLMAEYWYMTLSLVTSFIPIVDLQHLDMVGMLFWGIVVFCLGIVFQMVGSVLVCMGLMEMWIAFFRYDKAYDERRQLQ